MKINNKIIVIGCNHHNTLGVIRSLGEKGINSDVIITNDSKYAYIKKSKYINKYYIIKNDKQELLKILTNEYKEEKDKPILIPTSDLCALTIDENYNILAKKYICPNVDNKQGNIVKYMDKYEQYLLAKKYNIGTAETYLSNSKDKSIIDKLKNYPYIIKPIVSAYGTKADMRICNKKDEMEEAFNYYIQKGFDKLLIQEFIDYDYELNMIGPSHNGKIYISGIAKKIRRYPQKYGSLSLAIIENSKKYEPALKIADILKKINYSGMFDIEIFVKGDKYYLNEINFRNSGNTYAYCYDDIYLIYVWVLMVLNKDYKKEIKMIDSSYEFIDDIGERNQLMHGYISLKEFLRTKFFVKAKLYKSKFDKKPNIYKLIYAILRRIDK